MIPGYVGLETFNFWCQKIIPLVYDNSLSYYEVLCKMAEKIKDIISDVNALGNQVEINTSNISQLQQLYNSIQQDIENIKNGDYVSLYINQLAQWIDNNLQQLVGRVVKYVFFGLTDDGYFCAYIPQSWDFISFDTVIVPDSPLYGHLLLRW